MASVPAPAQAIDAPPLDSGDLDLTSESMQTERGNDFLEGFNKLDNNLAESQILNEERFSEAQGLKELLEHAKKESNKMTKELEKLKKK